MMPVVVPSARPRELLARNWDGFLRHTARQHIIRGGNNCALNVMDFGDETAPPLLFIHGWSQSWLCWMKQVEGLAKKFRVVCMDNRGQGDSDKPRGDEHYNDGALWAADVKAVIDALALKKVVLNGWSYGGNIICDYLNVHGTDNIAGLHFVGASVISGSKLPQFGPVLTRRVGKLISPNSAVSIAHVRKFVRECTAVPSQREVFETVVSWTMQTPAHVRLSMLKRTLNWLAFLGTIKLPALITHGTLDYVMLPVMAHEIKAAMPHATLSLYDGVGHMPFLEDPTRFNRELAGFAEAARQ
ncbi:MAG: alpha/beta fold hydrolase [Beijerinckiaceae bacterium]